MFDLVKTTTKDKLYLHGLLNKGNKNSFAVLYIHSYGGDFYSSCCIPVINSALSNNGITFLSVQTRGTGLAYRFTTTTDETKIIGGHYELIREAYLDIDAWIEYLVEQGFHNIVLMGSSVGTMKVTRYLAEGSHTKYVKRLVLLAPFDAHALANKESEGKYRDMLHKAKEKINAGEGRELVPEKYSKYGMSYQTIESLLTFDHFGKMFNFDDKYNNFMLLNKINIPVKAIVGANDDILNPANPQNIKEAIDILKLNIQDFDYSVIEDCNHTFDGKEHEVAKYLLEFLEKDKI